MTSQETRAEDIVLAAAVIRAGDGRFLTVRKRGTRALIQPGGKIEPGETSAEALAREIAEELGVELLHAEFLWTIEAPAVNEPGLTVVADVYAASIGQAEPAPAAEIAQIVWLAPGSADSPDPALTVAPLTRIILERLGAG